MTTDFAPLCCAQCDAPLTGKDRRPGWYHDAESIECQDCGATNNVSLDDDDVWVGSWVCKHGKSDTDQCDLCEIEAV